MVHKDYINIYIYIRLNEMSKNEIIKFFNFISYMISIIINWRTSYF